MHGPGNESCLLAQGIGVQGVAQTWFGAYGSPLNH